MPKKTKFEVSEELTTHRADFKKWPIKPAISMAGQQERSEKRDNFKRAAAVQKDTQTLDAFEAYVPFDVYGYPKPILQTNPRTPFEIKEIPRSKAKAKKSPIISPQVHLEEADEETLKTILKFLYTTHQKELVEDAALPVPPKPSPPNSLFVLRRDIIKYTPVLYKPLPEGWVDAAKHWDALQTRFLGDPFRTFWERKGPEIECGCCYNPVPGMISDETKKEIRRLIDNNKLRLPYERTVLGYDGYRPICGKGVKLEQTPGYE